MLIKTLKISLLIVIISFVLAPLVMPSVIPVTQAESQGIWQDSSEVFKRMQDGTVNKDDIKLLIEALVRFLLEIIVLVGVLFLIIGGYQYITSAGNPDQIQKAKSTILYSVIGIAVAGLARAIVMFATVTVSGPTSVSVLIERIINQALFFIIGIAVLFLIIGGYQYITSAGNPDQITKAKKTITAAISGIIVAILSQAIASLVYRQATSKTDIAAVLIQFINTALGTISLVGILFIIVGGYQYMTSAGNPDQIQKAKNTILYSVIGLAIAILSFAIVRFVAGALGVNI